MHGIILPSDIKEQEEKSPEDVALATNPIEEFFEQDTSNPASAARDVTNQVFGPRREVDEKEVKRLNARKRDLSPIDLSGQVFGSPGRGQTGVDTRSLFTGLARAVEGVVNKNRRDRVKGDPRKANSASFFSKVADTVGLDKVFGTDFTERSKKRRSKRFAGFADKLKEEKGKARFNQKRAEFQSNILSKLVDESIDTESRKDVAEAESENRKEEIKLEGDQDRKTERVKGEEDRKLQRLENQDQGGDSLPPAEQDVRAGSFEDLSSTGQNIYERLQEQLEIQEKVNRARQIRESGGQSAVQAEFGQTLPELEQQLRRINEDVSGMQTKFSGDRINSIKGLLESDLQSSQTIGDILGISESGTPESIERR